jgi:hypothetical protein
VKDGFDIVAKILFQGNTLILPEGTEQNHAETSFR